ncbi:MAG: PaaI family thioesterase [Pacificimonas sp.]|jgi:acyl-coenzyme A thioesterase PaaI-like protein|nr:PaaI family thioesterase [Pacificimonas sp.]
MTRPKYSVPFVDRTGMTRERLDGGYAKLRMPLAGNENHVGVMYMGAYTVLAEATAANPGIAVCDPDKHFPIIKDLYVDFRAPARSDVTAEYELSAAELDGLAADLERKGSAGYTAEFPIRDTGGRDVCLARVTVKLLSHDWPPKGA